MKTILTLLFCLALGALTLLWWRDQPPAPGASHPQPREEQALAAVPAKAPTAAPAPASSPAASAREAAAQPLLPLPSLTWEDAPAASSFARFAGWTHRYRSAANDREASSLEAEGIALARERLDALAELIQIDPKRALGLAVPLGVRQVLPSSIQELLEERVSAKGDLMVLGAIPLPGREDETQPISRMAKLDGRSYDAFTFGWRQDYQSSGYGVPIIGIAAPAKSGRAVLAVSPELARLAEPEEAAVARAKALGAVCGISGLPSDNRGQETAVDVGGEIQLTCSAAHAALLNEQLVAAASGSTSALASGASSGTSAAAAEGPAPLAVYDTYTTGRKRFLLMRPGFSDVTNTMTDAQVPGHFNDFSNHLYQMSYGRFIFAGLGHGSDVTPIMKLPGVVTNYDNTGLGKLYDTCKGVAQTNYGYNLSQYDFLYVVTGGQPAATYAGLGFVRGVGFHLANGYYGSGTASHEFGHNLGLNHANFWSTLASSIIGTGTNVEYGDVTDVMGSANPPPDHYNSRYKNYLTWIQDTDIATVTSANSGTFRVYSHDLAEVPGGLRGLKIVQTASQNYWVNFRQRFTSKAMQNGVQVLWTGNGNQSSHILDLRLKDSSTDNVLFIGRTFSDTTLGMHITPIGKGHTSPESMDVVVNVGAFPANQPPTCVVSADSTNAAANQIVTFTASATDPNGDPLAYAWDFGDTDFSIDNSATQKHSFTAAGEYAVQCTVSDMKGGTARDTILVRVGVPTTFRITGRVLRLDQRPFPGIKVFADSSHSAYSDSDGTYSIMGLGAGSYSLGATEPVYGTPSFSHPFFNSPVTVGPSLINMDFIVGTAAPPVTLVATGSVWKYLDNGSDQGTAWIAPGFDDSLWVSGPGQLGYGDGDEATVVSYGPDQNNKYTTTYFRRAFTLNNVETLTNIIVNILRDDGAITYLNGVEIFRSNMPTSGVTYATFASTVVADDGKTFTAYPVPPGLLINGVNVLAVEIHQADLTSSDISFELSMTAQNAGALAQGAMAYLTSPSAGTVFTAPINLTLTAVAMTTFGSLTNVEFYDGATKLGEDPTSPFSLPWSNVPQGTHSLTVRAKDTSGQTTISAPVTISVVPGAAPPVLLSLLTTNSTWSYFVTNSGPSGTWTNLNYDDSAWLSGPGRLGFSSSNTGLGTIINGGPAAARFLAAYFRQKFVIEDPSAVTNLTVLLARDDGAVVYLNGVEILRDNIQNGAAVSYGTLATNSTDNGGTYFSFKVASSGLAPGTNVIAVEVHQSGAGSSDMIFDLGLSAVASTNRARGCWLVSPSEGATIALPGSVVLAGQVVVGGVLGVAKVEFFSDGSKVGENVSAPYSLAWTNPPGGAHQLVAVATDSAGESITSAPVNITVTAPPVGVALISFGDVWNYLDDGSNQGTNWSARTFDDHLWSFGPGRLGYGGDGELTTISYGTNTSTRNVTAYFRKPFVISNPAAFSGLLLRLIRDDGAAVYLNGTEVYRNNLQPGLVSWNSLATATVNAPDETTPIDVTLTTAALRVGTNVIAVEIHQSAITDNDAGFDLALLGLNSTNTTEGVYLTAPGAGAHFNSPASVTLSAYAAASGPVTLVRYYEGLTILGQASAPPYSFTWVNPPVGAHGITARAAGTGILMTSAVVNITIGPAPAPIFPVANTLIAAGSSWKFWDSATAVTTNWQGTAFDDTTWPAAPARFGWGLDGEVTTLTTNRVTHYFRRWFTVPNPALVTDLTFGLERDDGAVVYLNGVEIFRSNMPNGPITPATLASSTVNPPDETTYFQTNFPVLNGTLNLGSNLVAVELHQGSATSSDAGFDLQLFDSGTTEERVYLLSPRASQSFATPGTFTLAAAAWGGSGVGGTKVEFYSDNSKVGEATAAPYNFDWVNPPGGPHSIVAVCSAASGLSVTSAPVTLNITFQSISSLLVASNSVWKYLDDGSDQGTGWAQAAFDDSAWASGPARLGYGAQGEVTTLNFGPDGGNKYITYYFRRGFTLPDNMAFVNLNFGLLRDDGAIGWLNGVEIFRSNIRTGAVDYTTLATTNVTGAAVNFLPIAVPASALVAGTNVLAIEVHQVSGSSPDLAFDLTLTGVGYALPPPPPPPSLTIETIGNSIRLSWPSSATGWNLYSILDFSPTNSWAPVTTIPVESNGIKSVTLIPGIANGFYRLQNP